jgi:hypothetical protein
MAGDSVNLSAANLERREAGRIQDGTRSELYFAEKKDGNNKHSDFAWLQLEPAKADNCKTWAALAHQVVRCNEAQRFGIHENGLADMMMLLSSTDSQRPASIDVPTLRNKLDIPNCGLQVPPEIAAQTDGTREANETLGPGQIITPNASTYTLTLAKWKRRGYKDLKIETDVDPEAHAKDKIEEWPRHKDAGVSTVTQRRLDSCLPCLDAAFLFCSDKVHLVPPLRIESVSEAKDVSRLKVQANTSILLSHVALVYESSLRCATVAGLSNRQESSHGNSRGPQGWSRYQNQPLPGDEGARELALKENCHTLPYSRDIVNMAICLNMSQMFHDDGGYTASKLAAKERYARDGFKFKPQSKPPQFVLPFRGYDEENRQNISTDIPPDLDATERAYIEAADPVYEKRGAGIAAAEKMHGKKLTDEEYAHLKSEERGSRSMGSRKRELCSVKELQQFSVEALHNRGLIASQDRHIVAVVKDQLTMCNARAVEQLSQIEQSEYAYLKLHTATPRSYAAMDDKERSRQRAKKRANQEPGRAAARPAQMSSNSARKRPLEDLGAGVGGS